MRTIEQKIKEFGDTLVQADLISQEQWDKLLEEYKNSNLSIDKLIIAKKIFGPNETMQILELYYGVPYVNLSEYILQREALELLSEDFCRSAKLIPINLKDDKLVVAMADPTDILVQDNLRSLTGKDIQLVFADEDSIIRAIDMYYAGAKTYKLSDSVEGFGKETIELAESVQKMLKLGKETPVVSLINDILLKAVSSNASDIHIEPTRNEVVVRFRVDGMLRVFLTAPILLHAPIASRIKIMSGLDISEKRMPQDGRADIRVRDRIIDLRVSTLPSIFGEAVAIRILDKKLAILDLENIGFCKENLAKIKEMITSTYGMLLICGPTGSGKTSTGYAICNRIKSVEKNTISIEDPVEYQVDDITQVQINHEIGLTFAKVLRSILRQDPDIVLVGEMRDLETADIAVHAALTGHLVISTLHTQDTATAIARLLDMGIHSYLINSAIRGVISQRLVRKICPNCKKEIPTPLDLWKVAFGSQYTVPEKIFKGMGCNVCFGTGYFGRTIIGEVLPITEGIRTAIAVNPEKNNILMVAKDEGLITLKDEAMLKAKEGITTIDEVIRVIL
ncbi:MAG: GspE/PulE family protein [Armatimonadota bacterium]